MSRLPSAPLVEVIFEIRWQIPSNDLGEMQKCQYLHGDLYAELKGDFPDRETLVPPDFPMETYLNKPAHRFRTKKNGYPTVQVGPGIVTVNTTDDHYEWPNYEKLCLNINEKLFNVYDFSKNQNLHLALKYYDFFSFDFEKEDVTQFLSNSLHIDIGQQFFETNSYPSGIGFALQYNTDVGDYHIAINKRRLRKKTGILVQHSMAGSDIKPQISDVQHWLSNAHDVCSEAFKNMTKGDLYESFKK